MSKVSFWCGHTLPQDILMVGNGNDALGVGGEDVVHAILAEGDEC